jgi:hypothetical protein
MHNPFFESLNGATEHRQKRVENHSEWGGSNFFTNDNKQTNEVFASIGEGGRKQCPGAGTIVLLLVFFFFLLLLLL